jgi:hypothetical protein
MLEIIPTTFELVNKYKKAKNKTQDDKSYLLCLWRVYPVRRQIQARMANPGSLRQPKAYGKGKKRKAKS